MRVRKSPITVGSSVLAVLAISSWLWAGPDIIENATGDAGSLPANAKELLGNGALNSITGKLDGLPFAGTPDFEDMYLINITSPATFTATTMGGVTNFNTQLWLFEASGLGLLANDDVVGGPLGVSRMTGAADDGTGATISAAGLYYLAISGFDNDPASLTGPIFLQAVTTEISGPDGTGGSTPVNNWVAAAGADTGDYTIFLEGVEFVPTPVPAASNVALIVLAAGLAIGGAVILRRRRAVA
jgi:hypothetical protein